MIDSIKTINQIYNVVPSSDSCMLYQCVNQGKSLK